MNYEFYLMAEFETADIPLELVAAKYLGMSKAEANKQAAAHNLPFPAYRVGSQRSSYFVNIKLLAKYLERKQKEAEREWSALNLAS